MKGTEILKWGGPKKKNVAPLMTRATIEGATLLFSEFSSILELKTSPKKNDFERKKIKTAMIPDEKKNKA